MEVAVNGIDGAGKSTFIREAVGYFQRRGVSAAAMDLPYFRDTEGFERLSLWLVRIGEWLEPKNRTGFSIFAAGASLFYWMVRWRLRRVEVLFVEHHPWIDLVPYARLYGVLPASAAGLYRLLWPKPDALILLTLPAAEASRRIRRRGRPPQWRQSSARLLLLEGFLRAMEGSIPARYIATEVTPQQFFDEVWEPYRLSRASRQGVLR